MMMTILDHASLDVVVVSHESDMKITMCNANYNMMIYKLHPTLQIWSNLLLFC